MLRLYTSDDFLAGRKPTCTRNLKQIESYRFRKKTRMFHFVIVGTGQHSVFDDGRYYIENANHDYDLMIDIPDNG
jgi:hypothetical protein